MRRVLLVLLMLFVVGCGEDPPEQGFVIDKDYDPAHWEDGYDTVYHSEYRCSTHSIYDYARDQYVQREECGIEQVPHSVYNPHHRWVKDRWRLQLQHCEVNDKGEEKCRQGWRKVSAGTYELYDRGDYFPRTGQR